MSYIEVASQIKIKPLLDTLKLEDISDDIYFSEEYHDYISNSRMGLINPAQGGSPQKYFAGLSSNPSTAFAFGSAVHELILQPESFFMCDTVDAPTAKVGLIAELLYNDKGIVPNDDLIRVAALKADYYKGNPSENQMTKLKETLSEYFRKRSRFEETNKDPRTPIYFDPKSRERVNKCLEALNNNVDIQKLLHPEDIMGNKLPIENEKTILMDIEVTVPGKDPFIMKLKAKLDNFSIDTLNNTITINDVKTTGKICAEFNNSVQMFHYYREIAFYMWLLKYCGEKFYGMSNPTLKGNFLVVETIPAYWTSVVAMQPNWFSAGVKEFITLLRMIAYYTVYGYDEQSGAN